MRVLVTWGSKRGGTAEIASTISDELKAVGVEVALMPASDVRDLRGYDAAIIGGALYGNRWHRDAGRLVTRHIAGLRRIPVWLFSSGPLDASADRFDIPPPRQVAVIMERIGARSHTTFGGRLSADAKGFPAAAMAKKLTGDWRNPDRIRVWARELARALPHARPRAAADPPAGSLARLLGYGLLGWGLCTALMAILLHTVSTGAAIAIHAVAAPLIFAGISIRYFQARGARDPLPTAVTFMGVAAFLDAAVVSGLVLRDLAMFTSFAGTWLPFGLIFLASWVTGLVMSMIPAPRLTDATATSAGVQPGHESDAGALGFFNNSILTKSGPKQ
jgi:menaquinone-dependent protoporphyrinogen oxidase